jgi:hypothetical protein
MNLYEKMDVFKDTKEKKMKRFKKRFKWNLNTLIIMLLYYYNWK